MMTLYRIAREARGCRLTYGGYATLAAACKELDERCR
jgi:hypothetical protein